MDPYILERKDAFLKFLPGGKETFLSAERDILGFDHGEIAYELCTSWNVPGNLATAIRHHHDPSESAGNQLTYIVHMADAIAMMSGMGAGIDGLQYYMDEEAVAVLGLKPDDMSAVMVEMDEYKVIRASIDRRHPVSS